MKLNKKTIYTVITIIGCIFLLTLWVWLNISVYEGTLKNFLDVKLIDILYFSILGIGGWFVSGKLNEMVDERKILLGIIDYIIDYVREEFKEIRVCIKDTKLEKDNSGKVMGSLKMINMNIYKLEEVLELEEEQIFTVKENLKELKKVITGKDDWGYSMIEYDEREMKKIDTLIVKIDIELLKIKLSIIK